MKLKNQYSAILLVSDITKGMKSIGSKALLEVSKNLTVIDYQIQYLKRFYYPVNIYICTGFEHDKIVKKTSKYKNITYVYNPDYDDDNQSGSLIKCLQEYSINNAIIINNGILPLDKLTIDILYSSIPITSKDPKTQFDIGCNDTNQIKYLFYDLPNRWLEFAYLNKQTIEKIIELYKDKKYNKLFLFELLNILMDHGVDLKATVINKNLPIKINTIKDLSIAKKHYDKYLYHKTK